MTDEQINIAIAELCSWRDCHKSLASVYGFRPEKVVIGIPPNKVTHKEIPNYCSDLNEMHEAEKLLQNQFTTDWEHYWRLLAYVRPHPIYATARQRAEAFLRTLGKWEDSSNSNSSSN